MVLMINKVMANADTPEDAVAARKNGAQGIGLCRTEHMVKLLLCSRSMFLMNLDFHLVFGLVFQVFWLR